MSSTNYHSFFSQRRSQQDHQCMEHAHHKADAGAKSRSPEVPNADKPERVSSKRMFNSAIKHNGRSQRRVFLDLFSGRGRLASKLRSLGVPVVSVDVSIDGRLDLCDPKVADVVKGWIRSRCIRGIWLGTPCKYWSNLAVPGVCSVDRAKNRECNAAVIFVTELISLAHRFQVPCYLENPSRSMIWQVPSIAQLCNFESSRQFTLDVCQFGARWRRRTRVQGWHVQPHDGVAAKMLWASWGLQPNL